MRVRTFVIAGRLQKACRRLLPADVVLVVGEGGTAILFSAKLTTSPRIRSWHIIYIVAVTIVPLLKTTSGTVHVPAHASTKGCLTTGHFNCVGHRQAPDDVNPDTHGSMVADII